MLFQLFATGGKFTTGVYSLIPMVIWHQYQLRQWYRWQNLLLLSLTPVVHLDLGISPRFFQKFEMTQMLFSRLWGKVIHEKI
jgi:hypothetical protein